VDDFFVLESRTDRAGVLRDTRLSSSPDGADAANLLLMDGEAHRRLREVVKEVIAVVEPLPPAICAEIESVVAALAGRDEFDLVADFGRPVAALVTAAVLGAGPLDSRLLTALTDTAANLDVWSGAAPPGADLAALRVAMFFLKASAAEGGGLALLRAAREAGRITEDELLLTPVMLAHAAYENSMNFLAAAGLSLVEQPGSAGLPDAAEVRRLVQQIAPTRFAARRVTEQVAVAGATFIAGDKLAVPLGDGLAFGLGRHACPGSRVAVAEGEVALRVLASLLTPDHVAIDVGYKTHPVFHGLTHATVTRRPPRRRV
jgi:cytochrome P450